MRSACWRVRAFCGSGSTAQRVPWKVPSESVTGTPMKLRIWGDSSAAAWEENSGSVRTFLISSADGSTEPEISLQNVPESGSTAPTGIPHPAASL